MFNGTTAILATIVATSFISSGAARSAAPEDIKIQQKA